MVACSARKLAERAGPDPSHDAMRVGQGSTRQRSWWWFITGAPNRLLAVSRGLKRVDRLKSSTSTVQCQAKEPLTPNRQMNPAFSSALDLMDPDRPLYERSDNAAQGWLVSLAAIK